ncbi:hypothetical protein NQ314_017293 [Rhamnusium bicolor]|uniref:Uncharacterized protein n=1 Tax=Rhamnusium bicolor TaxID=1586634 RepID=A0AAV8WUN6_9CUCU|nr:hypothetical protein NQ314_017293 [Rhamnusium bicolor]
MRGDAEFWFQIIDGKFEPFEQFESLFLQKYWGEYNQQRVRHFNGRYYESDGVSREKYTLRKYCNIRYLEPCFTEPEMVMYLSRHFEDDIHKVIITKRINTMDSLIEYLRTIDDDRRWRKSTAKCNENRRTNNDDNKYNFRQNFQQNYRQDNRNQNNRDNREQNYRRDDRNRNIEGRN